MSTTQEIQMNYLQVPSRRNSNVSQPRPSTSSIINPTENSERFGSNLSLRSAGNSILKQPNSTHERPSTSSHLSVHYSPIQVDDEDKVEFILTPVVQTSEDDQLDSNQTNNHRTLFNILPRWGLRDFLQRPNWSNPFTIGRSNDENVDAYKILSILYGLVIFIGGVAFSISHAIIPTEEAESIKHLAEIYFTYLYWVSISWIVFCILDIVHHRRKLNMDTKTTIKSDKDHVPINNAHIRLLQNRHTLTSTNGHMSTLPSTPHFNLQLFDDSDELQSDGNGNEHKIRRDTISSKQSHNDDDDDDDDNNNGILQPIRSKSHSLENLSTRSSVVLRKVYHPTRDVFNRRHALDPGGIHNLRNYVRNRKDSIVQRVIGYNYDDNSTAGGLYIRVGIGIFCLGTVIHSGLSILSNLEHVHCVRWTAVIDDFSRLLFSFSQFFFIFKHSNLIIRAHERLARLAVMHIVVTNLCVWFRMVVVETKSQIIEMGAHEMALAQSTSERSLLNGSQILNPAASVNHYKCQHSMDSGQEMEIFITEGYMRLKPLLYPCTIEFSLMCLTLFYLIWENIGKTFAHKMSDKASTKNVFMVNCHASIKGLFAGMIVFSCTIISVILYAVFRNKIGDDIHSVSSLVNQQDHRLYARAVSLIPIRTTTIVNQNEQTVPLVPLVESPYRSISKTPKKILYSIAIIETVNLCLLIISLTATLWALMKTRKLQYKRTTTRFDDVLIIVSLTGTYLYTVFSAFALLSNTYHSTGLAYLKIVIVVLEFIEGTVHAFFILVALRKRMNRTNKHQYPAREIITLLIMIDLSLWFEETTTTTKHEANPFQLAFYHIIPWSIIAAIATPLQIFFRFHASVCLSHVWENMYILPAYEPVAPHGL